MRVVSVHIAKKCEALTYRGEKLAKDRIESLTHALLCGKRTQNVQRRDGSRMQDTQ